MMADSPWPALPRPSPRPAVATATATATAPSRAPFLIRFAFGVKVKALTIVVKALTVERAFFPLWDQRLARKKPTIPTEATSRELKPKTLSPRPRKPGIRLSRNPTTDRMPKKPKRQKGACPTDANKCANKQNLAQELPKKGESEAIGPCPALECSVWKLPAIEFICQTKFQRLSASRVIYQVCIPWKGGPEL